MKKFLILYNIIFLLAGNVLLANLHILHDHEDDHYHESNSDIDYHECEKCINFQQNTNYISSFENVLYIDNKFISFRSEYFYNFQSINRGIFSSRAPPFTENI